MSFILLHEILESNGKTIKENNLAVQHKIPIGTLVEVKYEKWHGAGACQKVHARLWIVDYSRDCDGTPLYILSQWKAPESAKRFNQTIGGFGEESLKPVPITQDVIDGVNALTWDKK